MAYIGKNPTTGSFIYADDITTSSTNTYNILVGGVAFSPESANHCIVSLNGVIQKANTSFSISGSQITFLPSSGTLSSSDSIDFLLILGSVNDVGVATTVSDQAITKAKTNFVSSGSGYTGTGLDIKGDGSANGRLGLLCSAGSHGVALESPDHSSAQSYTIQLPSNSPTANKFIKVTSLTGSGATAIAHTQFADAGGITEADQWRVNTTFTGDASPISSNWERVDQSARLQGYLGTGMSESSGVFTFPSTGFYLVIFQSKHAVNGDDRSITSTIKATTDNSNYYDTASNATHIKQTDSNFTAAGNVCNAIVDVQDTSNDKVQFTIDTYNSSTQTQGETNQSLTTATFIRLGDT